MTLTPRCSCPLPTSHYGAHGWHWRPFSDFDVREQLKAEIAFRGPEGISETERSIITKLLEDAATAGHYHGLPVAYERCPAYYSAARRADDRRKAAAALRSSTVGAAPR